MDMIDRVFGSHRRFIIVAIICAIAFFISALAIETRPGYHDLDFGATNMHYTLSAMCDGVWVSLIAFFGGIYAVKRNDKDDDVEIQV